MKKKVLALLSALVFCLILPLPASANSAEPPQLSVVVEHPPDDLELSLVFCGKGQEKAIQAEASRLAWEGYYLFRPWGFPDFWDWGESGGVTVALQGETGGEEFLLPLDTQFFTQDTGSYYNNLCVLDLSTQTLTPGQPWWRQPLLVGLRVLLTLVLEGLIFLVFSYRQKHSWLVFLVVNLITQLFVNLVILSLAGPFGNLTSVRLLLMFVYLPMELVVLGVEITAYRKLLGEQSKRRATVYAAVANLCSWLLGGMLLTYLPV